MTKQNAYDSVHASLCDHDAISRHQQTVTQLVTVDRWEHAKEECLPLFLLASLWNDPQPVVALRQISQG